MLGKLIKHEFAATGRIMLPALAAVAGITLLANLMLRFGDALAEKMRLLVVLFVLVIIAAIIAVIAVEILTIVLMVLRFYRHILGPEGYLTHALPVNVHQLVWSKIIVSSAWIVITNVLLVVLGMLTLAFAGRMNLGEILLGFPTWKEIMELMAYVGVSEARAKAFVVELVIMILASLLVNCLHFYAAMALGHMFSKNKLALSVLFYVGINIVFSILGVIGMFSMESLLVVSSGEESLVTMMRIFDYALVFELIQAALLYVATVLGLKKGLNLA